MRGGARVGAGRKPKADEVRLAEQMDAIGGSEEILASLYRLAKTGDVQAQKLWLSYRYGQPKQTVEQHNIGDNVIHVVYEDEQPKAEDEKPLINANDCA